MSKSANNLSRLRTSPSVTAIRAVCHADADEDIEAIAETVGKVGYHSMEVWGGATFDTMHRFLGEDPWRGRSCCASTFPRR